MESRPDSSSRPDALVGRVLDGRYRILSLLAKGGMGRIYRAEQQPLGRVVALKILDVRTADDPSAADFKQRFFREASICSKLTHPNTVRIFDYGHTEASPGDDGIYFIAMEYLEGQTLRQAMGDVPMAPWRVIDLMLQICGSLAEAHSMGIIHRDLKPSNVILTRHADGREHANVVDFGLVKDLGGTGDDATQAGMIMGSPMYMSPEQILQADLDGRSDIYSLGVILYCMLTGRKPFQQESPLALMNCHINVPPPPFAEVNPDQDVPASLEWVTRSALAKNPADRFASVKEMSRALKACDLELRGVLPNLVMELDKGKVRLPPEFDAALDRRSSSGSFSSTQTPTLVQPPREAPRREPQQDRRSLWALLIITPVVGVALGVLIVLALRGLGSDDTPPAEEPTATQAEGANGAEAPAPAPADASAPTEPASAPKVESKGDPGGEPKASPAPKAQTTPPPGNLSPRTETTPPKTKASAAPDELRSSRGTAPAPTPAPTEAPKGEDQAKPDDWQKPSSDIKDPWKD